MPDLQTRSLDQMVSEQALVAQAEAPDRDLDFSRGSVFRALSEAYASLALWLQGLVLRLLATTRASTSRGADLDTWMADYGLTRTPATVARGQVTFSRFTPGVQALVPIGAQVKTADGAWTYTVAPQANASLDEVQQGYTLAAGQTSITVPVVAVTAGAGGNAAAGTVSLLSTAIPYVDRVTNATPITGGAEAETDDALVARFRNFIASLPRAVRAAIDYVIAQVQPGLTWSILEGQGPNGTAAPATFSVILDDGTGSPPPDLLTRVAAAVEPYRALGVSYFVVAPVRTLANITMAITTPPGEDHAAVVGLVATALTRYVNGLPLGATLSYTRLAQVAYAASPLVSNISLMTLNGGVGDIPPSPRQAIRAGVIAVS